MYSASKAAICERVQGAARITPFRVVAPAGKCSRAEPTNRATPGSARWQTEFRHEGKRRAESHAELQRSVREARQPRLPARRQVHAELLEVPPQHAAHQERFAVQAAAAAAAAATLDRGGAVRSI